LSCPQEGSQSIYHLDITQNGGKRVIEKGIHCKALATVTALKGFTNITVGLSESFRFWHIVTLMIQEKSTGKRLIQKWMQRLLVDVLIGCSTLSYNVTNRSKVCMKWSGLHERNKAPFYRKKTDEILLA
jgi:hypothetical protein